MHPDFWHQRWAQNQIGFHEDEPNAYLKSYWRDFAGEPPGRVLVPLCGKSLDLRWLAEQGWYVLGVELSQLAVENFFQEWGRQPREQASAEFRCYSAEGIEILCGDFFHLEPVHLEGVTAVYDRAALVAMPQDLRENYAALLGSLLPHVPQMVVCIDYDQQVMNGPPFSVSPEQVKALYSEKFDIDVLTSNDVLEDNARFKQRGLTTMQESVYHLRPRQD